MAKETRHIVVPILSVPFYYCAPSFLLAQDLTFPPSSCAIVSQSAKVQISLPISLSPFPLPPAFLLLISGLWVIWVPSRPSFYYSLSVFHVAHTAYQGYCSHTPTSATSAFRHPEHICPEYHTSHKHCMHTWVDHSYIHCTRSRQH